jgi:hypothetical protein
VNGETLRFTSDQGQGIYADLTAALKHGKLEVDSETLFSQSP